MSFPWFAVQVRTRAEALVGALLRQKSYETFLPSYVECRQYSDRIKQVEAALFPGYLFCRLDPEHWLPVVSTAGVRQILSINNKPAPLDEAEIAAIRQVVTCDRTARPWPYLKAGDRVRVEFGSFSGIEGILVSEKGSDRLVLSVSLLQRSVSIQIERSWVRPVAGQTRFAIAV